MLEHELKKLETLEDQFTATHTYNIIFHYLANVPETVYPTGSIKVYSSNGYERINLQFFENQKQALFLNISRESISGVVYGRPVAKSAKDSFFSFLTKEFPEALKRKP